MVFKWKVFKVVPLKTSKKWSAVCAGDLVDFIWLIASLNQLGYSSSHGKESINCCREPLISTCGGSSAISSWSFRFLPLDLTARHFGSALAAGSPGMSTSNRFFVPSR
jgi:hypothetical protein